MKGKIARPTSEASRRDYESKAKQANGSLQEGITVCPAVANYFINAYCCCCLAGAGVSVKAAMGRAMVVAVVFLSVVMLWLVSMPGEHVQGQ